MFVSQRFLIVLQCALHLVPGAVAASMLGFVLPAALYIKTYEVAFRHACHRGKLLIRTICCCGHGAAGKGPGEHVVSDGGSLEQGGNSRGYHQVHSTLASGHGLNHSRSGLDDVESGHYGVDEEEVEGEVTVTFHHAGEGLAGLESGVADDTGASTAHAGGAGSRIAALVELHSLFRPFYLCFVLIVFGFASLIIGVTTVLIEATQ
jgi:hypothetical protein